MRRPPRRLAMAALLLLPFAGVACGGGSNGNGGAVAAGHVNVVDNRFVPQDITIGVGDAVTWDWKGIVNHNVTGPGFNSGTKRTGSFEHTFNSAGSYEYVCTLHAGMKGKVVVE